MAARAQRRFGRRAWALVALVVVAGTACTPGDGGDADQRADGPPPAAAWYRAGEGRIEARYAGDQGYVPAGPSVDVTLMALDVEGEGTAAVCVERYQWLEPDDAMAARSADEVGLDGAGRAAWLAANHASVPGVLEADEEHAALQLAVWHVVGDLELAEVTDPTLSPRVEQLVAASEGQQAAVGPARIELELSSDGDGAAVVRLTGDGAPMVDQPVRVQGPDLDEVVVTGADGTAAVDVPAGGDLTARWEGTAPPGTVVEPADEGGQALMTTDPVALVRTDGTSIEQGAGRAEA